MSALIELIVKVLGFIFSATYERREQLKKETEHAQNIADARAAIAAAPSEEGAQGTTTAGERPVAAGSSDLMDRLASQHDRVRSVLIESGAFTTDSARDADSDPAEVDGGQPVHGQRTSPPSAPALPRVPTAHLIEQLKDDEGFRSVPYWDVEQWTYGYGCKALNENERIDEPTAAKLLVHRAQQSVDEFFILFAGHEHKFNEVRQECFINMLYNMGLGNSKRGMRSFVNTLAHIRDYDEPDWSRVSYNLSQSKWYGQVGKRAVRICKEVKTGVYA